MSVMLGKCRNKKLTKSLPVYQQLISLNKEEIELKKEMLRKMDYQEQQFNQIMKILQETMTRFADIISGALQMMGVAFQQKRNNVMVPPGNNYPSYDAGFSQCTRQHAEWDGQERDAEKH